MTGYLGEIEGFTPAPDVLLNNKKYGAYGALVWGVIWRHTQLRYKKCFASLETLAGEIGVSVNTFIKYRDMLIADGYFLDENPGATNKTHVLVDTEKLRVKTTTEVVENAPAVNDVHSTVNDVHSTVNEVHSGCERGAHKETIKDTIEETIEEGEKISLLPSNQYENFLLDKLELKAWRDGDIEFLKQFRQICDNEEGAWIAAVCNWWAENRRTKKLGLASVNNLLVSDKPRHKNWRDGVLESGGSYELGNVKVVTIGGSWM